MSKIKIAWIALLAGFFLSFSLWYGGNGKPLTPEQGAALIERLNAQYGSPDSGSRGFITNLEDMIPRDDGKEFYAVNLEDEKEGDAAKASGQAYGRIVLPLLLKRASHPVFISQREGLMLGTYGNQVDRVAVVRYRSLRDMIEMSLEPAMEEGEVYKFGALNHTEVFITRPILTFLHIRLLVAMLLIIIGGAGLKAITFFSERKRAT